MLILSPDLACGGASDCRRPPRAGPEFTAAGLLSLGPSAVTMEPTKLEVAVPKLVQSIRLDKWLLEGGLPAEALAQRDFSRTLISKLIEAGQIRVNGIAVKKSYKVLASAQYFHCSLCSSRHRPSLVIRSA